MNKKTKISAKDWQALLDEIRRSSLIYIAEPYILVVYIGEINS